MASPVAIVIDKAASVTTTRWAMVPFTYDGSDAQRAARAP